jgi:diguanylate cyclase (GGDEF)-like protein
MHATFDNFALDVLVFAILTIAVGLFALLWALRQWVRWRRKKQPEIAHQAMHDALTGLPNREGAWQHLDRCLADRDAVAALGGIAVLRIDLDGFKGINDQLGQEAGDELHRQVARRILASLRDTDFVARLGGGEFLVTLPQESGRENTMVVATKLLAALAAGYEVFGHTVDQVTASIGVSRCPGDAAEREALMECADIALNLAKSVGRNTFRIFEPTTKDRPL